MGSLLILDFIFRVMQGLSDIRGYSDANGGSASVARATRGFLSTRFLVLALVLDILCASSPDGVFLVVGPYVPVYKLILRFIYGR